MQPSLQESHMRRRLPQLAAQRSPLSWLPLLRSIDIHLLIGLVYLLLRGILLAESRRIRGIQAILAILEITIPLDLRDKTFRSLQMADYSKADTEGSP